MRKKLPWLVFDSQKQLFAEAKEREKQTKQNVHKLAQKMIELRAPIE